MTASDALATAGLSRRFGAHMAISDLNLQVHTGDIYGFLGPNGAGKTTAIRCILGLLPPTSGSVSIHGISHPVKRRVNVGALVESPAFRTQLSARQNLQFSLRLSNSSHNNIEEVLELVGLRDRGNDSPAQYSMGMRQRLGIARALIGDPTLLILDEPTNGLDPKWRKHIRDLLLHMARDKGKTIVISSHLLSEIEQCCNRVGIINNGILRYQGEVTALRGEFQRFILRSSEPEKLRQALDDMPQVTQIEHEAEGGFAIHLHDWTGATLNRELAQQGLFLSALIPHQNTLEEAFLGLTKGEEE